MIYHYYLGLDLQIARININSSRDIFVLLQISELLIEQLHTQSSPGLSLQHPVRTAHPGIIGHVLPVVKLLLHLVQYFPVPCLVGHVVPLLGVFLPVKQFPLRSEVILLERDVPGQRRPPPSPHEDVLKCGREVTVLVDGEWRPEVEVVDQCEPSGVIRISNYDERRGERGE